MEQQFSQKTLYFVQAYSNIHCGTGQGVGDVDLPTAREAATRFPLIPGSTVKGVMRDFFTHGGADNERMTAAFGPDFSDEIAEPHASALMITDARVLFLPVRAYAGVFAYVTCPLALKRFARDLIQIGETPLGPAPAVEKNAAIVAPDSENLVDGRLLLEDLDLVAAQDAGWDVWRKRLLALVFDNDWGKDVAASRMTLVGDDVFSFLCDTSLPVTARIKLDKKTGTVARGALWYEESIPSETILSGLVAATDSFTQPRVAAKDVLDMVAEKPLTMQLGGMATTGKGLCQIRFSHSTGNKKTGA